MRNVDEIESWFDETVKQAPEDFIPSRGITGAAVGWLNRACGGDANRKLFLKAIFGRTSTKMLMPEEVWTLDAQEVNGEWCAREDFQSECRLILEKQADQPGQEKMFEESG